MAKGLKGAIKDQIAKDKKTGGSTKDLNLNNVTPGDKKSEKMMELLFERKLASMFFYPRALREDRVGLHASSIIAAPNEFCIREQLLALYFRQTDGDIPPGLKRIFEQGICMHDKWEGLFQKYNGDTKREYRCFSEETGLYLTPDIISEIVDDHPLFGMKFVGEVKSMNTWTFKKAQGHPSGEKQTQVYMHFTGIPNGLIIADDKNDSSFKCFFRRYDPSIVYPYLKRLMMVNKYNHLFQKAKTMPERQCKDYNCARAKRCNMRDACYNAGDMGREWLPDRLIIRPTWSLKDKKK